ALSADARPFSSFDSPAPGPIMNDSIEPVAPPPAAEAATVAAAVPPAARGAASDTPPPRRGRKLAVPLAAVALAAALLALGIVPRIDARAAQRAQVASQQALPVSVVVPGAAPADQTLTLPGSVMPYADASIYARTSGY
ncbi:hypothetical protein M3603_17040, partial [Rummeliibacillus stabekisii]|nr:hypothetical protein [Rummeliibacillus stabekisii]